MNHIRLSVLVWIKNQTKQLWKSLKWRNAIQTLEVWYTMNSQSLFRTSKSHVSTQPGEEMGTTTWTKSTAWIETKTSRSFYLVFHFLNIPLLDSPWSRTPSCTSNSRHQRRRECLRLVGIETSVYDHLPDNSPGTCHLKHTTGGQRKSPQSN